MEEILQQLLQGMEEIKKTLQQHTAILQQHTETLNQHTAILQQHTETLNQHTAILQQHTETLDQHTAILQQHTETLDQHTAILQQHTETLDQHSKQLDYLQQRQIRIENRLDNELLSKINVLFDAFELRGDDIARLRKHLDERLDVITLDINYLLGRTARQETALMELRKAR
ncbi:hypothetical protein [Moorella sulfitireducens (nom. illeg.)]|uniref:hypothetical protein n=1 Tax=Neomoorella sulfitireducens TaxID=2972948 RepID=UPI0021ABDB5B|nr:hypothetical protein [Moorella sulfitireducens]